MTSTDTLASPFPLREHIRLLASARLSLWFSAQVFLLINHFFLGLALNVVLTELILALFALSAVFYLGLA